MDKKLQHEVFLNIADEMSRFSHCVSHKVAAVVVKDNRILSTGINGTPAGFDNCDEIFEAGNFDREKHHQFSENYEIHAEINAILFAAKNDISIDGAVLYTNLHPCNHCLKAICNSGIKKIYYRREYDKFTEDEFMADMLRKCGVTIERIG